MNPSELEPNFRSDPEKDWGRQPPLSLVATSLLHHVDVASRSASRSYRCESLSPKPWFTAAIVLLLVCNKLWMAFFRAKRLELLNPLDPVRDAQTHHSIMSDVEFPHLDHYGLEFGFSCTFGIQLISTVLYGTHCDLETNAAKRVDDRLLIMTESMMQHPDGPWKRVLCFTEVEFDPFCSRHSEGRLPLRLVEQPYYDTTIHDSLDRKVLIRKADTSKEASAGHRLERHMGHDWSIAQQLRFPSLQDLSL